MAPGPMAETFCRRRRALLRVKEKARLVRRRTRAQVDLELGGNDVGSDGDRLTSVVHCSLRYWTRGEENEE